MNSQSNRIVHQLYPEALPDPDQIVFRISWHEGKVVLIDELSDRSIERHRPNFYSQTDLIYTYILRNPIRVISINEVEKNIDKNSLSVNFTQVISDLKFTGKLRELFFRSSKSYLIFYNPITLSRMQTLGIKYEDIATYLRPLKTIHQ